MNMSIFVEGSDSQQSVGPEEHDSDEGHSIQAEVEGVQTDVVRELSLESISWIQNSGHKVTVDGAKDPQHSCQETVELGLVDAYSILEVVDDEDEDGCKETDCVDDGQRQVELSCRDGQPVNHHDGVALEQVREVDVVFEVQGGAVIAGDTVIEGHGDHPPNEGSLDRVHLGLIGEEEGEGEQDLRDSKQDVRHPFRAVLLTQPRNHYCQFDQNQTGQNIGHLLKESTGSPIES